MDSNLDSIHRAAEQEITLFDLWSTVWDGKFLILTITGFITVIAVAYALLATEWYRAETLLVPADNSGMSEIGGQLSGLAALAGIRTGAGNSNVAKTLAVLRSRAFARDFIEEFELLDVFVKGSDDPEEQPDMRDAVRFFHENVLRVSEDRDTGQVVLAVEWKKPELAAQWANTLVNRLNNRMREQALRDAESNINYLRTEMASNNVVALEQTISRVMEGEMQKLMLARGNEEYAFRVIDMAEPPRVRSRPRRTFLVASVFVLSGILSLLIVFTRSAIQRHASTETPAAT